MKVIIIENIIKIIINAAFYSLVKKMKAFLKLENNVDLQ
jgi:hypothetical protein